jgi:superoxide dismutase, Fe-Mn family
MNSYSAKNFDHLIGAEGFSKELLTNHFALYEGYVKNTNQLAETLLGLAKQGKTGTPEYAELHRRFGWEFNGMRLHEYYFGNMTRERTELKRDSEFHKHVQEHFGSYDIWEKDYKGTGAMRGIGWCILYYEPLGGRFFNTWVEEHNTGHLSGAIPILVMDVFEHAFVTDYGIKRNDYIEAFFRSIDWTAVTNRLAASTEHRGTERVKKSALAQK